MNVAMGFTGILVVLVVFLLIANRSGSRSIEHPDDFFLSKDRTDGDSFGASQVSYSLQMATVYPYFYYAFLGMWWLAAWNTIFFFIGILLLSVLLPRFSSTSKLHLLGSSRSLHAFISNLHEAPMLRKPLALVSILAFTGLAAFEIIWGAKIIGVLFSDNVAIYYFSVFAIGLYVVLFLWNGGLRAAINSDQLQLLLAYLGLHLMVSWMVSLDFRYDDDPAFRVMSTVVLILGVAMLVARMWKVFKRLSNAGKFAAPLNLLIMISLAVMLWFLTSNTTIASIGDLASLKVSLSENRYPLIAFALMPLFFQFVDFSNWQRMASLMNSDGGITTHAKRGFSMFMLESPLSWTLPVILGMCAMTALTVGTDQDPWAAFLHLVLSQPGWFGSTIALFAVFSIISIFLSTVDSLVSAIGYTFAYDVRKSSRLLIDNNVTFNHQDLNFVLQTGRIAMASFLGIALIMFVGAELIFGQNLGHKLIGLFLAFFSPILSLSPAVIWPAVSHRVAGAGVALFGILGGCTVGIALGVLSVVTGDDTWGFIATIAALAVSWPIYILGTFSVFGGKNV